MSTKSNNRIRKQLKGQALPKTPALLLPLGWISLVLVFVSVSSCSYQDLAAISSQTSNNNTAANSSPAINSVEPVKPATASNKKIFNDYDGDGKTDPAKFDLSTGTIWWLKSSTGTWDGLWVGSDIYTYITGSDFDGDGKTDPAKFYRSTGTVWWVKSSTHTLDGKWLGSDTYNYVSGSDFDGDGKTDPAKFIPDMGTVLWFRSSDGKLDGQWLGSKPFTIQAKIAKHYNALWRINSIIKGFFAGCIGSDTCLIRRGFVNGEIPTNPVDSQGYGKWPGSDIYSYVAGSDFDGDGKTDPAKFVAETGTVWWIKSSDGNVDGRQLGSETFTYIPASDFDGDGKTDPAKYVPSTGAVWWMGSITGILENVQLGNGSYTYVPAADFNGDGKTDPAKYDDATHTLSWLDVGTGTWTNIDMGTGTFTIANGP